MQECQGGTPDIPGGCPKECADKGLTPGTPEFTLCVAECRGCPPGQTWNPDLGTCVPDEIDETPDQPCAGGYRLADQPIAPGGGAVKESLGNGWFRDPETEGGQYWHQEWGFHSRSEIQAYLDGTGTMTKNNDGACKKGFSKTMLNGDLMCCPNDDFDEDGGGTGLGEWQWPQEMQDFWKLLLGRGTELLGMPTGITPGEQSAMFGKGFETVRGRESAQQEAIRPALSRSGGLGTGMELESQRKISRGIEEDISDIMRDLLIYGSERKKSDLLDYTGAAQSLFGTGMGYENLQEAINAGRRGEADRALMLLLSMFGGLQ